MGEGRGGRVVEGGVRDGLNVEGAVVEASLL